MSDNPTSDEGHFVTFHKAFGPAVGPGPSLDAMISRAACSIQTSLHDTRAQGVTRVRLFKWIQHEITIATTDAEFGPGNPFRCPEFESAWYELEPGVPFMATNVLPTILARKALKAREYLTKGFAEYFRCGHHKTASEGVLVRLNHSLQAGFTMDDVARGEIGSTIAILNNSVSAAFWMIHHVFSDPSVLDECRKEVDAAMRVDHDRCTVDFSIIKTSCPALQSTFQEVLRYRGIGNLIVRQVLEDHILDSRFLVKKGGLVLIPNAVQHFKNDIWGDDAGEFHHRRFVSSDAPGGLKRYNQAAFRPFGGGSLLCPGRHFATTEILCFAALMVASFDVKPVHSGWSRVKTDRSFGMGVARLFLLPDADIDVEMQPRGDLALQYALTGTWSKYERQ
ncbi:unnamed protein product [Clonostachys rhizophaga]|uniref:Cytochrome P450 n=1 Tax=Clonostachys rhizophaga TaxID=160324 RepID=A0A9N9VVL2_9HYPO|nr:unnamed protein product [Clonostachys rhizophaga]